ncbi:MAG: alpha/beta fold hydrolase [Bryobacterales bacterium]
MQSLYALAPLVALLAVSLPAQPKGKVDRVEVRGRSLEGNLSGDSPVRRVSVYLPPSYASSPDRRYPVLYFLHGFTDSESTWMGWEEHWISLPAVIDRTLAAGGSKEMIVVMPDAHTRFFGSMYSSSVTVGDWETYVAQELVAYVDSHYRTLPQRSSRGLAGHSMGGYGTVRIGMRNPKVFSSIYALSPCCMAPQTDPDQLVERAKGADAIQSDADLAKASFGMKALFASAAAWSPNPLNPPFYLDLPSPDRPEVAALWSANAPLALVPQTIPNLRKLKAIAFDAGKDDRGIAATVVELDKLLDTYEIDHFSEIYDGNHVNHIDTRIEQFALPFFSKNLVFE